MYRAYFSKRPNQRSKVIQRSSCFRNALWPPNLVGRTHDQSVMHYWGKSHAGVNRGQFAQEYRMVGRTPDQRVVHYWGRRSCRGQTGLTRVKSLRNALWLPDLVGRTLDQSVVHRWGRRSCRCQPG